MKRIALVCSAGMSTSLLVLKMEQAAKDAGIEVEIIAMPEAEFKARWQGWDIVLLGPQVRFLKAQLEKLVGNTIPVEVIDMMAEFFSRDRLRPHLRFLNSIVLVFWLARWKYFGCGYECPISACSYTKRRWIEPYIYECIL